MRSVKSKRCMPSRLRVFRRRWAKIHQTWNIGQTELYSATQQKTALEQQLQQAHKTFARRFQDVREAYKQQKRVTLAQYRTQKNQLAAKCKQRLQAVQTGNQQDRAVRMIQRQWYADGKKLDEYTHQKRLTNRQTYEQDVKLLRENAKLKKRRLSREVRITKRHIAVVRKRWNKLQQSTLTDAKTLLAEIHTVLALPCEDVWLKPPADDTNVLSPPRLSVQSTAKHDQAAPSSTAKENSLTFLTPTLKTNCSSPHQRQTNRTRRLVGQSKLSK